MEDGGGDKVEGSAVDIKQRWFCFAGSRRHCPMPYAGTRVTVVYFSVPLEKCRPQDLATLSSLGFRTPASLPLREVTAIASNIIAQWKGSLWADSGSKSSRYSRGRPFSTVFGEIFSVKWAA